MKIDRAGLQFLLDTGEHGVVLRKVGNLRRPGGGNQPQGQKEHPKHRALHGVVSFLASAIESVTLS